METRASIDIGSHTARLLVARVSKRPPGLVPVARRRAYTRLGEDFDRRDERLIRSSATDRVLNALGGFIQCLTEEGVTRVCAVATGVVREARNRDAFLERILRRTGIRVRLVDGAEEARLTGKGVLYALGARSSTVLIFDLGGGSTEFVLASGEAPVLESIPVGAAVLTKEYLPSDPPCVDEVVRLSDHIDACLDTPVLNQIRRSCVNTMVGTGGTVTTLAAMIHDIPLQEVSPDRMNGLPLAGPEVEALYGRIKKLTCEERARLPHLELERARVMVAGALAVLRIMHRFARDDLTVCLSDLLEGILLQEVEGERDG